MVAHELVSETFAHLPLPPSERDFELCRLVVTEGASTRAAAQAFGLSQTRVIQIRDRVAEWIASEVPPLARATPAQRLALAAEFAEPVRLSVLAGDGCVARVEGSTDDHARRREW